MESVSCSLVLATTAKGPTGFLTWELVVSLFVPAGLLATKLVRMVPERIRGTVTRDPRTRAMYDERGDGIVIQVQEAS